MNLSILIFQTVTVLGDLEESVGPPSQLWEVRCWVDCFSL